MPGQGRKRTGAQVRSQSRAGANISAQNISAVRAILVQMGFDAATAAQLVRSGRTNDGIADALRDHAKTLRRPR